MKILILFHRILTFVLKSYIINNGVNVLRKYSIKYKIWHDNRCRKIQNKHKKKIIKKYTPKNATKEFKFVAPQIFSLTKNSEDTKKFFLDIIECYSAKKTFNLPFKNIFLDLSQIEYITPEAIMYIIALTNSLKTSILHKTNIRGNFPKNKKVRNALINSGFLNYVNSNTIAKIEPEKPTIQIVSGDSVNSCDVAKVIDFITCNSKYDKRALRHLYTMLIEIMTNSVQHAYNNKDIVLKRNWYMYIEIGDNIDITILDIGEGIPNTVRHRIKDFIYKVQSNTESKIIFSALNGDFRTETSKSYRGKGMPYILSCYKNSNIKKLNIISGKGSVSMEKYTTETIFKDSQANFSGTVFYICI